MGSFIIRTDTARHTKAFGYPVTQTRLDIPRRLVTQSHRHGWTYQGVWLPSHTDTAGHTKAFGYPVTQTRLDIPRRLVTQSWTTLCKADANWRPVGPQSTKLSTRPPGPPCAQLNHIVAYRPMPMPILLAHY